MICWATKEISHILTTIQGLKTLWKQENKFPFKKYNAVY